MITRAHFVSHLRINLMRKRLLPLVIALIAVGPAGAQEHVEYGVYAGLGPNPQYPAFRELPGIPSCCPSFESGSGLGFTAGVLYGIPLAGPLVLDLRAGFSTLSGTLTAIEPTVVFDGDRGVDGAFEHRIDVDRSMFFLAPQVSLRAPFGMRLSAGLEAGFVLDATYAQRETIVDPPGAYTFIDSLGNATQSRIRNESNGALPEGARLHLALVSAIGYPLKLNPAGSLLLIPELRGALGMTPVVDGLSWNAHTLRFGVAVIVASPVDTALPVAVEVESPSLREPALEVAISAHGVSADGIEEPVARVTVEEFLSVLMTPLLGAVFFDEGSAEIPSRYERLTRDSVETFVVDRINSPLKLPTYHHVLNIVGKRLKATPTARLSLTGTNQGLGIERGDVALSRRRAEAIRDYLVVMWGVERERIDVLARDLPANAANSLDPDGAAENRRVELASSDATILAPIVTNDTLRRASPPLVRFRPEITSDAGADRWRLDVDGNEPMWHSADSGNVPRAIDWPVDRDAAKLASANAALHFALTVTDRRGLTRSADGSIPVEQITIRRKRSEQLGDRRIARFSLILFDVRSAELSASNRALLPSMLEEIEPGSTVSVTGYSDRLGDAAFNQQLAEQRAATVARALDHTESVNGTGEVDLYDASLPEGRLYSRTVEVIIETPVDE